MAPDYVPGGMTMVKGTALVASAVVLSVTHLLSQPIPAGMKVGLAAYLQAGYEGLKADLTEAADMMPGEDYSFRPAAPAEMRTFGQLFAHVAEGQFGTCAAVRGLPNPVAGRSLERDLKTKQELVGALADSFTFCDDAFEALTDANALEFVRLGRGEVARSAVLAGIVAHSSEMYGIATVYLRARHLVPPSTRRQQRQSASPK